MVVASTSPHRRRRKRRRHRRRRQHRPLSSSSVVVSARVPPPRSAARRRPRPTTTTTHDDRHENTTMGKKTHECVCDCVRERFIVFVYAHTVYSTHTTMDHVSTHDDGRWTMDDGRFACHGVDVRDDDDATSERCSRARCGIFTRGRIEACVTRHG